jgi:hypothetical protein
LHFSSVSSFHLLERKTDLNERVRKQPSSESQSDNLQPACREALRLAYIRATSLPRGFYSYLVYVFLKTLHSLTVFPAFSVDRGASRKTVPTTYLTISWNFLKLNKTINGFLGTQVWESRSKRTCTSQALMKETKDLLIGIE